MRIKYIYRGVKPLEYTKFKKNGIPKGTVFTTDMFMAMKHGKVISIPYSKSSVVPTKDNSIFRQLKIKERYFITSKRRKGFNEPIII